MATITSTGRGKPTRVSGKTRKKAATGGWNLLALAIFFVIGFPVYWMLNTAVKKPLEWQNYSPHFIPQNPTLENFSNAFHSSNFTNDLKNSIIITCGAVAVSLVIGFFGALAIARFSFYGKRAVVFIVLLVQMVPLIVLVIPIYQTLDGLQMRNTLYGIMLTYLVFTVPYTVWTLRGFIANIPKELDEAALVDGCNRWQTFIQDHPAAGGPGSGGDLGLRLHPGLERVPADHDDQPPERQAEPDGLARRHRLGLPRHRLGNADGRSDAHVDARRHPLPGDPEEHRYRSHRRRGQGIADPCQSPDGAHPVRTMPSTPKAASMSDQLLRDAAAVLQPGFVDAAPGRAPDWVLRALAEDGLGGVAYYGRNIGAELSQTAALSAQLKAENPDVLIAVDEEGGDVTRLHVATGSLYPGNLALGFVDDTGLSEAVARELGGLLRRRASR